MRAGVVEYLPWLLSAITIWQALLSGNKSVAAWPVGMANQALWLVWIAASGTWGMLPMNAALWVVFLRNWMKWSVENG